MQMDLNMANLLHQKWKETIQVNQLESMCLQPCYIITTSSAVSGSHVVHWPVNVVLQEKQRRATLSFHLLRESKSTLTQKDPCKCSALFLV